MRRCARRASRERDDARYPQETRWYACAAEDSVRRRYSRQHAMFKIRAGTRWMSGDRKARDRRARTMLRLSFCYHTTARRRRLRPSLSPCHASASRARARSRCPTEGLRRNTRGIVQRVLRRHVMAFRRAFGIRQLSPDDINVTAIPTIMAVVMPPTPLIARALHQPTPQ